MIVVDVFARWNEVHMYLLPLMCDYVDTVKIPIFNAYYDSTPAGVCVCDVNWYEDHSQSKISFTLRLHEH